MARRDWRLLATSGRQGAAMDALRQQLESLGVDADRLHRAVLQSMQDPTQGYDDAFGKPAIKAYRAFYLQQQKEATTDHQAIVVAGRCARQVDFLRKRHLSQQAEWVRHTDDIPSASRKVHRLVVVLDNVRSAFNVGSLYRTADACGCTEVITTGITPHPRGGGAEKVSKSALGAERFVPTRHFDTMQTALHHVRTKYPDWKVVGMETTEQSVLYTDMEYPDRGVVLVLGNEVTGVDTEIMPLLDAVVEIPMFGAKNSLNIAACAPVVLYEILRQWGR